MGPEPIQNGYRRTIYQGSDHGLGLVD
jgi:hypothetical protein